jgi:TPR repeat protein
MKRIVILTILIGSLVGYVEASADNSSPKPQAKMTSSSASLFQSDVSAYDRKNYSVALKVFTELAKQGYAAAQLSLGVMYVVGEGVPKDYVQAAK